MKFSNEKIYHRSENCPNTYDAYFQYHPKYNSITSLKENTKQNDNLNPDEEYYLVQNKNNTIAQMKSVSFQPNKKIYQKNGILSGENLNNLMNQYINYSIHKRKKIKSIKNKKEENKENKEYASKKGLKQVYMEHLIKEGIMVDVKNLKKVKKKTLKDKLTQRKKNFLNDLGVWYGSNPSSNENSKDNKDNNNEVNNYFNYYKEGNDRRYFNTLSNFYSVNTKKINYYSPNHNNLPINKEEISSEKDTKKIKKPKINQFEYITKIKKEINKIKTEPNNYLSVQTKSPKSTINNRFTTSKLTTTLNDSFRQSKKKIKKRIYYNTNSTKRKDKKINLKKVGKKLINLNIKTKNENIFHQRNTHRSPEDLHYYIKNKKIMRKKNEEKKRDKVYRDLFHKFKNLCTLNNFSTKNSNKGNQRKQLYHYSPNPYNTITIMNSDNKSTTKKKKSNNPRVMLGSEPKKNLNSTLIDANEYYLNILESKKLIRNNIYNKTEFNFYRNKYLKEENKNNDNEDNNNNILALNKNKNNNNKEIIKKISKKIIDVLIKAKQVFSNEEVKNINKEKSEIKEEKNNKENKKLDEDAIKVNNVEDNKKDEKKNEAVKFIEEHNNKIQFLYDFENNNIKNEKEEIKEKDENEEKKENIKEEVVLIKESLEKEETPNNRNDIINEEKIEKEDNLLKEEEKPVKIEGNNIDKIEKNQVQEKVENRIDNPPIINEDKKIEKELDSNKMITMINIINNIIKKYSFKKLYKYYIQIVIIENYFIGIKYIIAICKKYSFSKLKRNLYNDKIFKALKNLIYPFRKHILREFFNDLKQIEKKKIKNDEEEKIHEIKKDNNNNNNNLNLDDIVLEEKKDKNYINNNEEDDILSELYKYCPNTINQFQNENKNTNNDIINIKNQIKEEIKENENTENNNIPNLLNNENINDININSNSKPNKSEIDIDKLTEEIIQSIISSEIRSKEVNLIPKKKFKYKTKLKNIRTSSSSNSTDNITNDNKLLDLSNLSKLSLSEEALNDSIMEAYTQKSYFFKTIIDKRKFYLIKFYQRKIAPKLIDFIRKEIFLKYDRIYSNISQPYENNSKELMISLILQDADMLRDNFKVQKYDETIADIIDKEKILNEFIPINIKLREEWQKYEAKKNPKANEITEDYLKYDMYMNKCLIDCAIELINCERKYGENGNPLIWSSRTRELKFKYPEKDPSKLANFVSKNIFKFLRQKNGLICDNYENLPGEIISTEREKRLINTIKNELEEGDYLWRNLEMEETQLKVEVSDCIAEQLYNEVIEILEHIQLSRIRGELYNYHSIYACDEMPKLGFQQTTTTENADNDDNNNDSNILFNKV